MKYNVLNKNGGENNPLNNYLKLGGEVYGFTI